MIDTEWTIPMQQPAEVSRREFLTTLSAGAVGLAVVSAAGASGTLAQANGTPSTQPERVKRNFAPHFGMFRHHAGDDLADQIRFMAENGFTALEDNGYAQRPLEEQRRIVDALDRHGMRLTLFVGPAHFGMQTFATTGSQSCRAIRATMLRAIKAAEQVNAAGFIVVPGQCDNGSSAAKQLNNAVDRLKEYAEWCTKLGRQMYLEPLNHWGRHPQMFLHSVDQAAELCRAVGSNSCKVLFDVYHQSVIGTDVFESIDRNWEQIGYFQIGDFPGRKEPGTGTFDFRRFFTMTDARGYTGYFGMEHGNSMPGREGEAAVLEAYRRLEGRA